MPESEVLFLRTGANRGRRFRRTLWSPDLQELSSLMSTRSPNRRQLLVGFPRIDDIFRHGEFNPQTVPVRRPRESLRPNGYSRSSRGRLLWFRPLSEVDFPETHDDFGADRREVGELLRRTVRAVGEDLSGASCRTSNGSVSFKMKMPPLFRHFPGRGSSIL